MKFQVYINKLKIYFLDLEQVLKYRVPHRVANMVERSSAFKSHSTQISKELRNFCDKLLNASLNINREGM